ncbi:MAG TPA: bifunctional riboflavin kinase/FAD synthetase [Acidimicrobiia bacterium]|nr:bifunctional riboflavin kinase/FAD synthetase [Acidimicrobiia bacterium]
MKVLAGPWRSWDGPGSDTSVTIGVLDGVHIGHRAVIARLDENLVRTVLTFDPHPVEVLRPGTHPRLVTTIDERIGLLAGAGADCVGVLDLNEIKKQTPEEFVEAVLVAKLGIAHLVVGEDFRFGKDRSGDVALLRAMAPGFGFEVETIELVVDGHGAVSSSRVRSLIEEGDVAAASTILSTWFRLTGAVVEGDKRGRELGFPTANLHPPGRKVIPATGVYACFATVRGTRRDAAVNVGVRPTFGGGELLVEAYVLDFDEDLYGEDMTLEFVSYLRPELNFDSVADLVARMGEDVENARIILSDARGRM